MQRLLVLFFLSALILYLGSCHSTPANKISVEHLQYDFKVLRKCLEEAHPGLYWYSTKKEMDHYFDSTYARLDHSMPEIEFFKILLPVVARVRCLHTNIIPSKQGVEAIKRLKTFPLLFKFINGKAFIKKDCGENKNIILGAEVIAINHVMIKDILTKLLKLLPADGFNETYKYSLLQGGLFREAFAMFIGEPNEFFIEAIDPGTNMPITFTVPSLTWQQVHENIKKENFKVIPKKIELQLLDSLHTAVFIINTFEIKIGEFTDSLQAVFNRLNEHKIRALIIDLRKNGGGNNTNVRNLFAFIADRPFLHLKKTKMATQHFSFLNYAENPEDFKNLKGIKVADRDYQVNYRYPGTSVTQPQTKNLFRGKIFILTSGATVSAASEFVILARYNKRATIIGEETGGCYYGATGGNYLRLVLPHSKIRVSIPTIRIYTAVDEDFSIQPFGRGVMPDVGIIQGDTNWLHEDAELNIVLKIIQEPKN